MRLLTLVVGIAYVLAEKVAKPATDFLAILFFVLWSLVVVVGVVHWRRGRAEAFEQSLRDEHPASGG